MRCTFLERLLVNSVPWKSPLSAGKGPDFCVSLVNTAPQGSVPQLFWVVLLSPSGVSWKSNSLPNKTVLGLGLDVVGGARISIGLVGIGLGLEDPHS